MESTTPHGGESSLDAHDDRLGAVATTYPASTPLRTRLGSALRRLVDGRALAWGYRGWRRVIVVARARFDARRLAPLLALARKNRTSITLLTFQRLSKGRRRRLEALPAIAAVIEVDNATYGDLLVKELVRARTRAPR